MEEACVRKRNSEESDYSSVNVHNARATQQQQLEEAEQRKSGEGVRHRGKLVKHVYGNASAVSKQ